MSNVAKALRAEISRVSRKEAKSAVDSIAKSNIALKKIMVDLKRRIAALEKENKRLLTGVRREKAESPPKPIEENKKARFTSKSIHSLRSKLGLSQAAFAKLVGVTPYSNKKARFTSKSIHSLRSKLGLSQAAFAKLVGVTPYVHLWETKEGALNLREKTREALFSIRRLSAREAKEKSAVKPELR
jgi:DNA-binding transcriptional regulator YiaG